MTPDPYTAAVSALQQQMNAAFAALENNGFAHYGTSAMEVTAEFAAEERRQQTMAAVADFDRDRLLHYCRLLDENDQGRRLAAARGISQFVKQHGLDWEDIIVKSDKVAGVAVGPSQTQWPHHEFVAALTASSVQQHLSQFEKEFCQSMANWNRAPTEKQAVVLKKMYSRYCSHVNGLPLPQPLVVNP